MLDGQERGKGRLVLKATCPGRAAASHALPVLGCWGRTSHLYCVI